MSDFYCERVFSGELTVERVYETANVLAFRHTKPHWPVHVVVVPKKHVASLTALSKDDESLLIELLRVVQHVAASMEESEGGAHVVTNLGKYQDSKHLHFHVGSGELLRPHR